VSIGKVIIVFRALTWGSHVKLSLSDALTSAAHATKEISGNFPYADWGSQCQWGQFSSALT